MSAANTHTAALRADGTLWAWGDNGSGQLGNGSFTSTNQPVRVGDDANWQAVSAGGNHTVALRTDGTLWTWGYNYHGELGIGTFSTTPPNGTNQPVQVGTNANWQAVAAASSHTLALRNGTLWAWGYNENGQLGIGTTDDVNRPVQVGTDANWRAIATGDSHSAALRADGTLWVWGFNASGQLGNGTTNNVNYPTQMGTDTDWQAVAVGGSGFFGSGFTVALRTDGTLWAWGDNSWGQIAQPVSWLPYPAPGDNWGLPED